MFSGRLDKPWCGSQLTLVAGRAAMGWVSSSAELGLGAEGGFLVASCCMQHPASPPQ